jgi:four helix bundle protein
LGGIFDRVQRKCEIAEGFDSETNPEFVCFFRYAKRPCAEVQSELYVGLDQQYITKAKFRDVYDHADL